MLFQSGFNAGWWPEAMTCFCFLRNVTEILKDGFTPYENRFLTKFKGPMPKLLIFLVLLRTKKEEINMVPRPSREYSSATTNKQADLGVGIFWLWIGMKLKMLKLQEVSILNVLAPKKLCVTNHFDFLSQKAFVNNQKLGHQKNIEPEVAHVKVEFGMIHQS